ncbi:MAG: hypothetical protein CVV56_00665 [Tenericutes bacterium HGW-Tenericutes-1]|nr:MAG: hypothetical protein CVV56_00665 [Tenericutes bacterium HGW-Tenericutes-1]
MHIENHTLYDKDLILRYNKYYLIDFLKKNFLIIALVTLALSIYMFSINSWQNGLILLGILVGYFIMTVVIQKLTTMRALKRSPIVDNPVVQHYLFTEESIEISRLKEKILRYEEVVRIQVNKEFFIIYDVNKKTHIVDLNKFENDTELAKLKEFLLAKLGRRFK